MRFAVLGAGSWGTALAIQLAQNNPTILWGRDPQKMASMAAVGCNRFYLPQHPFPDYLSVESDLQRAIDASEAVLVVCPSHAFGDILNQIKP